MTSLRVSPRQSLSRVMTTLSLCFNIKSDSLYLLSVIATHCLFMTHWQTKTIKSDGLIVYMSCLSCPPTVCLWHTDRNRNCKVGWHGLIVCISCLPQPQTVCPRNWFLGCFIDVQSLVTKRAAGKTHSAFFVTCHTTARSLSSGSLLTVGNEEADRSNLTWTSVLERPKLWSSIILVRSGYRTGYAVRWPVMLLTDYHLPPSH